MNRNEQGKIRLGRLELAIMSVVWARSRATVHDVRDALSSGRSPAYSTILTMMRKLEAKGYLRHELRDRTFVYEATISRQAVRHSLVRDLLDRLFEGSPALLLSSLVEQNRVSDKELGEIRKLLRQKGKKDD